jgi:surface polysaccharide O-acyltransferase-like enzyme
MFTLVQCAGIDVPQELINVVNSIVKLIQIGIPLLLIIFGMLDLGKAVMAQKEDEIKKGQQTFIKRLIAAAIVFFVVAIVQLVLNITAPTSKDTILECVNAFVKW